MTQFSFDGQPVGVTVNEHSSNVGCPALSCAFQPVVVIKPGIQAIMEGMRLANVERIPVDAVRGGPASDINP